MNRFSLRALSSVAVACAAVVLSGSASAAEQAKPAPAAALAVGENMDVAMEYTLTVEGKVVDSTDGRESFHYVHGRGQILPELENRLAGLHPGDSKEVALTADQGYGQVDPAAFVEVPKDRLPAEIKPEVGQMLEGVNPENGKNFRARIHEVKDSTVVLDLNHPLAGKPLNFKVTIKEITPAKEAATPAAVAPAKEPTPAS